MNKKKICFIAQFPPPIHGLSKAVDTLYNSKLNSAIDSNGEFEFEKIDITNNKRILSNIIAIKRSKADLFYFTISQTRGGNLRDLVIFKAIGNRKCLIHLHGGFYRTMVEALPNWQRRMNYKAIKKLSGAIVLGPSLKWIFEGMLPDERIFTVPNCIDDEYLMSDEEFENKIRFSSQRKIKHVLYLSNFIRSKGYREVLELAKLEKKRVDAGEIRKFHFDFAGNFFKKDEEDYFWNYVKNNDLKNYVSYHGIVKGFAKNELLKKSDFFCLLTTYPNEGQPISILEAMGNGMVIVTTNHAGIGDLVIDNLNGIVINKNNINVLSCYRRLLEMPNCEAMEIVNRDFIKRDFNQDSYINNMKNVFIGI